MRYHLLYIQPESLDFGSSGLDWKGTHFGIFRQPGLWSFCHGFYARLHCVHHNLCASTCHIVAATIHIEKHVNLLEILQSSTLLLNCVY
jgi:hypothetical protein